MKEIWRYLEEADIERQLDENTKLHENIVDDMSKEAALAECDGSTYEALLLMIKHGCKGMKQLSTNQLAKVIVSQHDNPDEVNEFMDAIRRTL